ncbi:MAG: hypothetical protein K6E75_10915 [Lachnospiraceae bacterium]|nr:hypothetical protein [Lachnospiraceae bacterium]MCR5339059.1 hypothetical protein [Lachnospiraceae bacterium]
MDNFMDKLSNRFHAGELIRANGEAEAKQMQSLKDANEQQAQVISEVRRLNLKTAEISEQISQMAAASIEKIEEYKAAMEAAQPGQGAQQAAQSQDMDRGSGWETEIYQGMSQMHMELQTIESLESSLMAFQESQTEQNAKLAALMQQSLDNQNKPTSWQTEVWQSMSLLQQQLQNVENLASSQAALQEQLQTAQSYFQEQVQRTQEEFAKQQQEQNEQIIAKLADDKAQIEQMGKDLGEQIRSVQEKSAGPEKPGFVYEIEAILSEIENTENKTGAEINGKLDELIAQSGQTDYSALEKQISDTLDIKNRATAESLSQIKELVVGLRVYLDEVEKRCEEFVHKEDVKVYRNVQASVMETVSGRTRDLGDRIEGMEKRVEKQKGMKGLMVITMLLSLASVVLSVLQILHIL